MFIKEERIALKYNLDGHIVSETYHSDERMS